MIPAPRAMRHTQPRYERVSLQVHSRKAVVPRPGARHRPRGVVARVERATPCQAAPMRARPPRLPPRVRSVHLLVLARGVNLIVRNLP